MTQKTKDFAVMRIEQYQQTIIKIIKAVDYDSALKKAESMPGRPDLKSLVLYETEVTVVGPE